MDTDENRSHWLDRRGAYSPAYYAYYDSNTVSDRIGDLLTQDPGQHGSILELGCSSGRHLAHLHELGFETLTGIDLNPDAARVMHAEYPGLADACTLYIDSIESRIQEFATNEFDAVYTVETLQHIHPDSQWIFEEIARIADARVITVETESETERKTTLVDGLPLYYREYESIFTALDMVQNHSEPVKQGHLRVFTHDPA